MKIGSRALVLLLGAAILLPAAHQVQPGHVPLYFEPNEGQAHASVQFLSQGVYLGPAKAAIHTGEGKPVVMSLVGTRKSVQAEGLDLQPGITSYFIGNDPKKWRSGVPHYAKVQYKGVYPGIDVVYYGNAEGRLEYDFLLAPGANPDQIELAYNYPVFANENGGLEIADVHQNRPRVYQNGREITCAYHITDNQRVHFALGAYDHSQIVTVDPVLVYSTYLGGPGYDYGTGIKVDTNGNAYITGSIRSFVSPQLNPFQQTSGFSQNAYVIKLSAKGDAILYYAILGGDTDTYGHDIALDSSGTAVIIGTTSSLNFPIKNAVQSQYGGGFNDAFVTRISSDGRSLVFSTYIGGPNADQGSAVTSDASGNTYIAASIANARDLPTKNAFQPSPPGGLDGYVAKLSAAGNLLYATYLGGSGLDGLSGISVGADGSAYITGSTSSDDFPVLNGYMSARPLLGSSNLSAFVTKLSANGALMYSTFVTGRSFSSGNRIVVDLQGRVFIEGVVYGPDFPVKNAAQPIYAGGGSDRVIFCLDASGSNLVFSTFLGGSADEYGTGDIALAPDGGVYVVGYTNSSDFPVKNPIDHYHRGGSYNREGFISRLAPAGDVLMFSTTLGGTEDDSLEAVAVDQNGNIYATGSTWSNDIPLQNALQLTRGGLDDIWLVRLSPDAPFQSPFGVTPSVLPLRFVIGGAVPSAQNITITSGVSGQPFTATSDAKWLIVSPGQSTTPATLTVSVNPSGLSAGLYSGTIRIDAQTAVQVSLTVLNPAAVVSSVSPSAIPPGSNDTSVTITGSGFINGAVVQFSGNSVGLPTTFLNATTLQAVVNKGLAAAAATYTLVVVNPQSAPSQPLQVTIGTPIPAISALTNAASYATGGVAPGEIISLFGTGLGPLAGVPLSLTPTGLVSTTLGGTQVLFDGIQAPLIYVRADQVSAIAPYAIGDGRATTHVIVQYNGQVSAVFTVPIVGSAPALFTADASGRGQGAILNEDGSVNSLSNPAAKGSVVVLYGTGEGATDPPGVDGKLAVDVLPKPTLPVTVSVDGKDAQVLYAGAAPTEVAGVIQVNVFLPNGVRSGEVPVVLEVGGLASQPQVTLIVQ